LIDVGAHSLHVYTHVALVTDRDEDETVRVRHVEVHSAMPELGFSRRSVAERQLARRRSLVPRQDGPKHAVGEDVSHPVSLLTKPAGFG